MAVLAVSLTLAASANAAAPRYILVSGPGLTRPVLMDDWQENGELLAALSHEPLAPRARLRDRPRYDLALFWGWTDAQRPVRPSDANQHGWFYPAHGRLRAVVDLQVDGRRVPRLALPSVLEILKRHGVPIRR